MWSHPVTKTLQSSCPTTRNLKSFEKTIYSKELKVSVAVPSFYAEILICQLCPSLLTLSWQPSNSTQIWPKSAFLRNFLSFFSTFLHQITEIREFVHFTSSLAWFCVNSPNVNFFQKIVKSKMTSQMTSLPRKVISSCRASSGVSNQCKFISLCLNNRGGAFS